MLEMLRGGKSEVHGMRSTLDGSACFVLVPGYISMALAVLL